MGKDDSGFLFPGHSLVFNSLGDIMLDLKNQKNTVKNVILSKDDLILQRRQLSFLKDRDNFTIN